MIRDSQSNFRMQKISGGSVSYKTFHAAKQLHGLWVKSGNLQVIKLGISHLVKNLSFLTVCKSP